MNENSVRVTLNKLLLSTEYDKPRDTNFSYDTETLLTRPTRTQQTQPSRVYVSGPMTNLKDFGRAQFIAGTEFLTYFGFRTYNPYLLETPKPGHVSTREDLIRYAKRDLELIQNLNPDAGDFVAALPGWINSRGAVAEIALATWLQIPVKYLFLDGPWNFDMTFDIGPMNQICFLDTKTIYDLFGMYSIAHQDESQTIFTSDAYYIPLQDIRPKRCDTCD